MAMEWNAPALPWQSTLHPWKALAHPWNVIALPWKEGGAAPGSPANVVAPSIIDTTPQVGETLTCTQGSWDGDPTITLAYQWYRTD